MRHPQPLTGWAPPTHPPARPNPLRRHAIIVAALTLVFWWSGVLAKPWGWATVLIGWTLAVALRDDPGRRRILVICALVVVGTVITLGPKATPPAVKLPAVEGAAQSRRLAELRETVADAWAKVATLGGEHKEDHR